MDKTLTQRDLSRTNSFVAIKGNNEYSSLCIGNKKDPIGFKISANMVWNFAGSFLARLAITEGKLWIQVFCESEKRASSNLRIFVWIEGDFSST